MVTDGKPNCKDPTQNDTKCRKKAEDASNAAQQLGIEIVAVGVGNGVDDATLRVIASSEDLVLRINDFDDLANKVENVATLTLKCDDGSPA